MRLHALTVKSFGCVRSATIELGPGLNVLFGPNDLGKSSLVQAIRAALLLPHSSTSREDFVPWRGDEVPEVELVLETDRRLRVRKSFGSGSRGSALLESSKDGATWVEEARARQVDDVLRRELRLGVRGPGGRGAPRGLPDSFLTTLLLPEQNRVMDVFARPLAGDQDPSGRERLADALQAMARDPVFAVVLARVHARVDEAFSPTGKLRSGRDAPLAVIRAQLAEVDQKLEVLEQEAEKGESVKRSLADLHAERIRLSEELRQATERRQQAERWLAARAELDAAREELAARESVEAAAAEGDRAIAELRRKAEAAEEQRVRAEATREKAATAEREAEAALEALRSEGESAKRKLQRAELEDRARALDILANVRMGEEELTRREAVLATLREQTAGEEAAVERAVRERAELEDAARLLPLDRARARLAEAERERAGAGDVPDVSVVRELEESAEALRVAEARAGVGIRLEVRPLTPLDLEVELDGGEPQSRSARRKAETFEARREAVVRLPGMVEIVASAGEVEAQAAVRAAREHYDAKVRPVLEALSFATLDELRNAAAAAEGHRTRAREAERDARAGLGLDAGSVADLARELEEREAGLTDMDAARARLEALAEPRERRMKDELSRAEKERDRADREAQARRVELARSEAELDALGAELERARETLTELAGRIDELDLEQHATDAASELTQVRERLEGLAGPAERDLASAATALTAAREAHVAATAAAQRATEQRDASARELHAQEGAQEQRQREAARVDAAPARARVRGLEAALSKLPAPTAELDVALLTEYRAAEQVAREAVETARSAIDRAEGALRQAGGLVAREGAQRLRASKSGLRERLEDTRLDYEAWRLLSDTLKEAENEEAAHLGRTVMPTIGARFGELTAGRYGDLLLGPELQAEGIAAAGGTRAIDALSVGTQEQLSTLFRMVLAEQLGTAVILDDQLTQTDPRRMRFFRERLREAARGIQVLVVTCHADDYLEPGELPEGEEALRDTEGVRAVDLERVVERA